jgi:hypothetical protein
MAAELTAALYRKIHNISDFRPTLTDRGHGIVEVKFTHGNDLADRAARNVCRAAAYEWAREHGKESVTAVSGGWTLGPTETETRVIFSVK